MRAIPVILIILAITWGSFGQGRSFATVKGNIVNASSNFITIGDSSIAVSSKGEFLYRIPLVKAGYYGVKYGEKEFKLFITPSEILEINFDTHRFESSLRFKGHSAAANYILVDHGYTDQELNNYFNYNWTSLFSKEEKDFIHTLDSLRQLYFRTINAFKSRKENLDKEFVFEQENEINLGFDRLILLYPQQHLMSTGQEVEFSPSTLEYLNSVRLDDHRLLTVKNYKEFGNEWIDWKIREGFHKSDTLQKKDNQWLDAAFRLIIETFENEQVRELWLYYYLVFHIENQGIKNIEGYIETFNRLATSQDLKDYINEQYGNELEKNKGHLVKTYKTVNGAGLDAHIFMPKDLKPGERRPAMVYFHGGSWSEGKPEWHFGESDLGFVSISVEYRTYGRHGVLPFQQVSDAKSFFRWLRQNSDTLQVDPSKIIASGNSAGGHLILCAAMIDTLDEKGENLSISSKPDFVILNSAVFDLGGFNWFDYLLEDKSQKKSISPNLNIKSGLPPMLVFHGTHDRSVPFVRAQNFVEKMRASGNKVDFYPIENATHELWFNTEYQKIAPTARKAFLKKHKVLE